MKRGSSGLNRPASMHAWTISISGSSEASCGCRGLRTGSVFGGGGAERELVELW